MKHGICRAASLFLAVVLCWNVITVCSCIAWAEDTAAFFSSGSAVTAVDTEVSKQPISFDVTLTVSGEYELGMIYRATDDATDELLIGLKIDGGFPFDDAQNMKFPRFWTGETDVRTDGAGNEFAPKTVAFSGERFVKAVDANGETELPYHISLTAGVHRVTVIPKAGSFYLDSFVFLPYQESVDYQRCSDSARYYTGKSIVIEAEKPLLKNSFWLSAKSDNASATVTPHSVDRVLVNYIGGGSWSKIGDVLIWKTPELKAGYYQLGFSYRQNLVQGCKTYRSLTVDGETPFLEAENIGFPYCYDWQQCFYADQTGTPYLIYLSAGSHEIALRCSPGETVTARDTLREDISALSELYIDITMVTGESVDTYRDYELFSQIPNMEERLDAVLSDLKQVREQLIQLNGKRTDSRSSTVGSMIQVIEQMLTHRFSAHRYVDLFYDKYCALASTLNELTEMPLELDKLSLTAVGAKCPFPDTATGAEQLGFSLKRFAISFVKDYNNISGTDGSDQALKIWVTFGRDQAQALNALSRASFSVETGVGVNIQLVNASVVQAMLSGKAPDCILQMTRSEPVNLAMRGALYDLSAFSDYDEALGCFQSGADAPYRYRGGLYALPDTQTFFVMFYRKDILSKLGIAVPRTWQEFTGAAKLLARNNLNVWMPNNVATSLGQINMGVGAINLFPSLLLQNGLSLYAEDGRSTTLTDTKTMQVFQQWTDYYRKLKIPVSLDFYNRFRSGTCPIGIEAYTTYNTLKASAPEIDGLWSIAPIPGTDEQHRLSAGGGTGCVILKTTKNPEGAWAFLKWWTSAQTQASFSNETEAFLGASGRIAISNPEAFRSLTWDPDMADALSESWNGVREVPEYPGSYYVSRCVYQSFWNVVDKKRNQRETLLKYGKTADEEIARKWKQYDDRKRK